MEKIGRGWKIVQVIIWLCYCIYWSLFWKSPQYAILSLLELEDKIIAQNRSFLLYFAMFIKWIKQWICLIFYVKLDAEKLCKWRNWSSRNRGPLRLMKTSMSISTKTWVSVKVVLILAMWEFFSSHPLDFATEKRCPLKYFPFFITCTFEWSLPQSEVWHVLYRRVWAKLVKIESRKKQKITKNTKLAQKNQRVSFIGTGHKTSLDSYDFSQCGWTMREGKRKIIQIESWIHRFLKSPNSILEWVFDSNPLGSHQKELRKIIVGLLTRPCKTSPFDGISFFYSENGKKNSYLCENKNHLCCTIISFSHNFSAP